MPPKINKRGKKRKYVTVTVNSEQLFGRRFGSLPSDDSDDASYEPLGETVKKTQKKRTRATKKNPAKQRKRAGHERVVETDHDFSPSWSTIVPNEILHKIFNHGVTHFGSVPFLPRSCQVCKKWKFVASWPSLWRHFDLSYMSNSTRAKDELVKNICESNLLSHANYLNLSFWGKLTSVSLTNISIKSSGLTTLIVTGCTKMTAHGLSSIAANCHSLTAIDLSFIHTDATSNMSLKHFLEHRGGQLNELYLAGNKSVGAPTVTAIETYCGNLKTLDLSDTSIRNLCPETLQICCPKITELRLAQLSLVQSATSPDRDSEDGFKKLELLSLASISGGTSNDHLLLWRLAKKSHKLRQLDLRGREKIAHDTLTCLPITSLEQLFLSRCKMSWKSLFADINHKWKHSLQNLDVSWVSCLDDSALMSLASSRNQNTVLTTLNLAGSGVTGIGVKEILAGCPNLDELNLTSCRGVPRGMKQLHNKQGIEKLRKELQTKATQIELDN